MNVYIYVRIHKDGIVDIQPYTVLDKAFAHAERVCGTSKEDFTSFANRRFYHLNGETIQEIITSDII